MPARSVRTPASIVRSPSRSSMTASSPTGPQRQLGAHVGRRGAAASFSGARVGRRVRSPPQLRHRPCRTSVAHAVHQVHSKEQIQASVEDGGRSTSQHSQPGRISSTPLSSRSPTHARQGCGGTACRAGGEDAELVALGVGEHVPLDGAGGGVGVRAVGRAVVAAHQRGPLREQLLDGPDDVPVHAVLTTFSSGTGTTQISGPCPAGSTIGTGQSSGRVQSSSGSGWASSLRTYPIAEHHQSASAWWSRASMHRSLNAAAMPGTQQHPPGSRRPS